VLSTVSLLMIVHHASADFTLGVRVIREVIHSSSGKANSANFACVRFSEGGLPELSVPGNSVAD
jgi:hypothetical protein